MMIYGWLYSIKNGIFKPSLQNHKGQVITPSEEAKHLGHNTLADAARIAGMNADTLRKWHTTRPLLFEAVCRGALEMKCAPRP